MKYIFHINKVKIVRHYMHTRNGKSKIFTESRALVDNAAIICFLLDRSQSLRQYGINPH